MKISHFPDFLPGETVYSVVCRYLDRMQLPRRSIISQLFFGGQTRGLVPDLPSSLEHLIQSLPPNHVYTSDMIIDKNTLFPFYAPFLPLERITILRQYMKNGNYLGIHRAAGAMSGKVLRSYWLKYCPLCVGYDRSIYGECYWHRLHQTAGVVVCPTHEIMLENSPVNLLRGNYNAPKFLSAEASIDNLLPREIPPHLHAILVQLAQNARWLLEHSGPIEKLWVQREYLHRLTRLGFATISGIIRYKRLKEAILEFYPDGLLEMLGCNTTHSKEIWFENWKHIKHPLHHLLLIQFLCHTCQEFFTEPQCSSSLFGNGPWPCLNPLCSHYKMQVITSCTIKHGTHKRPVGTFTCHCGFTYSRSGPDRDNEAIYSGKTLQYGTVWDQCLTAYWSDQNLSTAQIAHFMHTDSASVRRQAARLNLPFAPDIPPRGKRPTISQDRIYEKRGIYRALWEEALESNPEGNLTKIIDTTPKARSWLRRHDPDWLKEHYPIKTNFKRGNTLLSQIIAQKKEDHYSHIDAGLAKSVRETAEKVLARSGIPIRVTRSLLIDQIGDFALEMNDLHDKLPMTSLALKDVLETDAAFIWRKLRWAVQSFLAEETSPAFSIFLSRAHISALRSKHPIYKQLIQFGYRSLCEGNSLSDQMPKDLIKLLNTVSGTNERVQVARPGSLAFAYINTQLTLLKSSKNPEKNTYKLISILLLVVAAIINGAENYGAIAQWGYLNEELLISFGFPEGRFPPPHTIKLRCAKVNTDIFEEILVSWLRDNFLPVQNEINETGNADVLGLRILRPYRYLNSEVVTKLY